MPLFATALQFFERKGSESLEGAQPLGDLRTASDLLDEASKLIDGMKDDLSNRQFKIYRSKHNNLLLMIVDVKSDVREGKAISGKEEQEQFNNRVQLVLRYCQAFHTDIVSASRKVYAQAQLELELPEPSGSTSPPSVASSTIASSITPALWDSALKDGAQLTRFSLAHTPPSGRPILGMIADLPTTGDGSSTQPSSDNSYTLSLTATCISETRVGMFYQSGDETDGVTSSQEITEFADQAMTGKLDNLADYELVDESEAISWMSSLLSSFKIRLPDVSSGMV